MQADRGLQSLKEHADRLLAVFAGANHSTRFRARLLHAAGTQLIKANLIADSKNWLVRLQWTASI